MFFTRLLKNFLIALGFLLIGFGIGMILAANFQIEKTNYWLIIVGSLILGGFFTALGIAKRVPKKEKIEEETGFPLSPSESEKTTLPESNFPEEIESPEESSFPEK